MLKILFGKALLMCFCLDIVYLDWQNLCILQFFFASELKYRTDRRNILLLRYDILHSCCPMTGEAIDELAKTGFRRWILSPF